MNKSLVLISEPDLEIIKYLPQKRTVEINSRSYFLQFPYMIFAKVKHRGGDCSIHIAFAKESNDFVYFPPFAHVEGSTWALCMGMSVKRVSGSYLSGSFRLLDTSLKQLIEWFWNTSQSAPRWNCFARSFEALVKNYGRYHAWARLTLKEVLEKTEFGKTSIENFVKAITENISDNEVVERFFREKVIDETIAELEVE